VGAFVQGAFRSSAAILGMAFIQNMYGDTGMAPLMIASAVPLYNIYSVLVLTFGSSAKYGGDDLRGMKLSAQMKKAFVNILKNPIIIGIVLGLPFSFFNVTFPTIVSKTLSLISQTATPVALLCIGAGFKGTQAIKKIRPTLGASFIKLVGQMLVFLPLAVWMGFRNQELVAIIIMLGSPATATGYVMAQNMGNDADLSSSIIVMTTLLSSVTLTLFIFICRAAGMI
jgi:predicted permease